MHLQNENSSPPKVLRKETDFTLPSEYDDLKADKGSPTDDEDTTSKGSDDSPPASVTPVATPTVTKAAKSDKAKSSTAKKVKKSVSDVDEKEKDSKPEVSVKADEKDTPKQAKKRTAKISESSSGKGHTTPATSAKKRRTKKDQED